ncbi:Uu.00g059150.m01.CDS01 [Anthostomella pinea]|uniref:tRNA-dihydrouridine(16/17) synthase [NAD(P)(+)] n=1 Tax=Anthostomella pinea TaxID=933095 RepID=A0AAI8VLF1_9PEZI|nr:Uu.00g059150.m01.CDS01 [Anthostomella pinea]
MASTLAQPKLHGRAFYESIGSPKFVVAPMVDQSEFAWRMLTRSFLTPAENAKVLAYTPMFHARLFDETAKYRESHFQAIKAPPITPGTSTSSDPVEPNPFLDGNPSFDRPLFVQFCANDPDHLLNAALKAAPYCDAVDLNLGCPQGIARKGHYGAFLQEDQDLVYRLINTLHTRLPVPVTAKIRILDTREATLAYARTVLAAGASIITVHGRRRDQKGHLTGVADWEYLRYLRENLPADTVIFANGNVLQHGDLERCLKATGADAVMSAEGNLSNPGIFAQAPPVGQEGREYWRGRDGKGGWRVDAVFRRYMDIIHKHVLQQEPPGRRPLFIPGDDEGWLRESTANGAEQEEGPARKKQRRAGSNRGGGGGGSGSGAKSETSPNLVAVRPHLFHLLRHFISRHTDIRDALARTRAGDVSAVEKVLDMVERRVAQGLIDYERTDGQSIANEPEIKPRKPMLPQTMAAKAEESKQGEEGEEGKRKGAGEEDGADDEYDPESSVATVRDCKRPWWVAQPIVRPLPKEALAKGSVSLKKGKKKQHEQQEAAGVTAVAAVEATERGDGKGLSSYEKAEEGKEAATKAEEELPKPDSKDGIKEPRMDTKMRGLASDELVCG